MERQSPSIFNDIVGPTMVGPSSSHTCGPSRIGYLAQQLLPGKLKSAVVSFAKKGAYTLMYRGQRSDMGYINGLLGRRPEDERLRHAFAEAKKAGVDIQFAIEDFPATVPNLSHITLENTDGEKVVVHSDSTGGGTVKLLAIDGFDVSIVGDCYELLVKTGLDGKKSGQLCEKILEMGGSHEGYSVSSAAAQHLINIKYNHEISPDLIRQIRAISGITDVKVMAPILTVLSNRHAALPFRSAEEMLAMAQDTRKELWELGIEYEMARSNWNYEQVWNYMEYVVHTMEHSSLEALKGDIDMAGILSPTAGKVETHIKNNPRAIDMGVLNTAIPWAMAAMEYSSAMGVVLCAPTGGSAGIFPGAILGTAHHLNLPMEQKIKAMFTTAILGIVMSKDCNYSAELYGCQVEPGAASGMAAGGLVYLMGGTPEQSCKAASCAVQNILGTICDPVAGLVQIPCINRNAMSAANAVLSANMVMGGFDPLIPLDQTAETLFRVGRQLPGELRCTCHGGLCITPCGQQLAAEQNSRDAMR